MEKKFKCEACGHVFTADTNQYVTCPVCKSDNVSLEKGSSSLMTILLIIGGIVVVAGVALGIYFAMAKGGDDITAETETGTDAETTEYTIGEGTTTVDDVDENVIAEIESGLNEEVVWDSFGTPQYNATNKTYSVTVKARVQGKNSSDYTVTYAVTPLGSDKVIAESKNGQFTGLAPIAKSADNPSASYQFIAIAKKGDKEVYTVSDNVSGFEQVATQKVDPISVAEMQSIIDNRYTSDKLAANPKLDRTIGVYKSGSKLCDLSKLIMDYDMGIYAKVTVLSLGYDETTGKVNRVNVDVEY